MARNTKPDDRDQDGIRGAPVGRAVAAIVLAVLVAACSPSAAPGSSSPSAGASVGSAAVPTDPASDRTVDGFLAFARSPSQSFSADLTADFKVGKHTITFSGTGQRSGEDAVELTTETTDGTAVTTGMATVGRRAFIVTGGGWVPQPPENVAVLSQLLLSFDQALVLEDLGRDAASGGHRLRVTAGISLYPYQMASIADAHDFSDRLEIVVDDAGLPLSALYTRSVSGTVDGTAATASGQATFTFHDVGKPVAMPSPSLAPEATLTPAASASPTPALAWTKLPLAYAPFQLAMPGSPKVSSQTVPNQHIGPYPETDNRLTLADGSKYTVIESQYPQSYVDARGVNAIAAEVVAIEAKNLGATVIGQRPLVGTVQPGLDAVLATKSTLYRIRVLVVGRDVLELGVVGGPAQVANADADRFMGSLAGS